MAQALLVNTSAMAPAAAQRKAGWMEGNADMMVNSCGMRWLRVERTVGGRARTCSALATKPKPVGVKCANPGVKCKPDRERDGDSHPSLWVCGVDITLLKAVVMGDG